MQHKGLNSLWTSIARAREANDNYRVLRTAIKVIFGHRKGWFLDILERTFLSP